MSADPEAEDFDAEALLADLEPLEDLDDAEFGLPPGWLTLLTQPLNFSESDCHSQKQFDIYVFNMGFK